MDYYYFPTSYWSRIISLVLAEKGLSFGRRLVDIRKNASFDPDYIRINPRGVVPTLVDEDRIVCNGPTIAEYLDEKAGPRLCRFDDPQVASWSRRLEDVPVMLFSYSVWVLGKRGEKSADILADKVERAARYAEQYPDLREQYLRKGRFFEQFRAHVYDDAHVASEASKCRELLEEMGGLVAEREYLCGEYSFADCIATSILYRLVDLGMLDHWATDPTHGLHGYYDRLRARPSYQAVWVEDPLIPPGYRPDE